MNAEPNAQLALLAWIVLAALLACVAAIVLLWRSGRTVPPFGSHPRRPRRA